jgi:TolB-like protein/Tfp pilus assembly protein PilF
MLASGSTLGSYQIIAPLGAGGMGEVYRAHDPRLRRDVAIKVLPASLGDNAEAVERLRREARAIAALSHPGILTIHDIGSENAQLYLVTELLEGESLRQRLARGSLPWRQALDVARAIADGLAAAHARGIVHRDLKPDNVFVTASGAVKILDFGVAKMAAGPGSEAAASTTAALTATGLAVGTVPYMAPEQLEGGAVDYRTDQFAFGIVLHEMLSGSHPFPGKTSAEVAASILRDAPRPLTGMRPGTPPGLARIVTRCLARDPSSRYAATSDLTLALDDVRADSDLGGWPTARSRGRRTTIALVATVIAASILVAYMAWRFGPGTIAPSTGPAAATPGTGTGLVAVLPFGVIGGGDAYLADGITEAVGRELGRVGRIRVLASNTSFAYRGRAEALTREHGVGLLVQGSIQRDGDRVRINASLVDGSTSATLWSERFDSTGGHVLALQDEIAWQVAAHLAQRVGERPPERPPSAQHTTPAAYDAYLRGLAHVKGRSELSGTGERLAAGIEEFERAVAADPGFALGHAMLASAYTQRFFYDATDPSFERKAFLEIEKALALNPNQAEIYLARAQAVWNVRNGFQHEQSVRDLQRAIANNPSLAEAYVELGKVYLHIGLLDKAIAANDEAMRLDPLATVAARRRLGALFDGGRFDEVRDILARNPRWLAPSQKAEALLAMGEAEAALETMRSGDRTRRDSGLRDFEPNDFAALAHANAKLGRRAEAERVLAAAIPHVVNPTGLSDIHHAQFGIGCAYALLGNRDEAVRWLTRAVDDGMPSYPKFAGHIDIASLKGHPAFDALLERLRRDWERWRATL